uniref:PP28 domain-containing protein n=1 Tax=Angiostrongylus cantonensis TaxID=6313 RepID=A0A0K0CZI0_ANGCA
MTVSRWLVLKEEKEKIKSKEAVEKKQAKEKEIRANQKGQLLLPYPDVKRPTRSQRRRRKAELEKDKKEKIASGFYQSRSDKDDTLDQVESLKEELTEQSRKRLENVKKAHKGELKTEKGDVNVVVKEAVKEVENSMPAPKEQP